MLFKTIFKDSFFWLLMEKNKYLTEANTQKEEKIKKKLN